METESNGVFAQVRPVTPQKLTYSVAEAAEVLGISKSKMYELVRQKGFPVIVLGKRRIIPIKGLNDWMERQAAIGWQ